MLQTEQSVFILNLTVPCIVTIAVILALLRTGYAPLDRPNDRSLHITPTPRVGGVAIILGAASGWLIGNIGSNAPIAYLSIALSVFCVIDDIRGLPVAFRFAIQVIAASIALLVGPPVTVGLTYDIFLLLVIVWGTNLFNFMDGSNGLAGGMALIGFGFIALGSWIFGSTDFLIISVTVSSASLGFLLFNFDPAKIFMGDAGSIPLGFLAAAIGVKGYVATAWPWTFPVLIFAPFIADSTVTLGKRILRGERLWKAHRDHYYQRMVRIGLGHKGTVLIAYSLMIVCGSLALLARDKTATIQYLVLGVVYFGYFGLMVVFDITWKKSGLPR